MARRGPALWAERDHSVRGVSFLLAQLGGNYRVSPEQLVLAWLMSFGPNVVPIPGATRVETAASIAGALELDLDDEDRRALDARFSGRLLRLTRAERRPTRDAGGDIVIVMGMPGAGKSLVARAMEQQGYHRLNRDEIGGALTDLVPRLVSSLDANQRHAHPRVDHNPLVEDAIEHVDQTCAACCAFNGHQMLLPPPLFELPRTSRSCGLRPLPPQYPNTRSIFLLTSSAGSIDCALRKSATASVRRPSTSWERPRLS